MAKSGKKIEMNRIKEALEKNGISQYRLHKESGISYSLINAYCGNKRQPGLEQLYKIAKTLKISGKDLINF